MKTRAARYERRGKIAFVTMNRPEKGNAMNQELCLDLLECWEQYLEDEEAWVAVLSGEGRHFCVGADISQGIDAHRHSAMTVPGLHYGTLECFKPIVAALHGYCLGQGMSMALGCDVRVCADDARLGYPHVSHGFCSVGGPTRLPRHIPGMAMYYLLTGELITPQEAHRLGLVVKVVPREELLAEATAIAEKICRNAPMAVRATKEAAVRQIGLPEHEGFAIARDVLHHLTKTKDYAEGIAAFVEKREPVWQGK